MDERILISFSRTQFKAVADFLASAPPDPDQMTETERSTWILAAAQHLRALFGEAADYVDPPVRRP